MNPRLFIARVIDLMRRSQSDRRLNEEIRLHLELLTQEFEARGMAPSEARAAARREFGGVDRVRMRYREERGLAAIDALTQDIRFASRVLARDRGFTMTAILVLALGIGVNNMMFTILNAHTIRGLPIDGRAKGVPNPSPGLEKKLSSKPEIVKALAASIEFCDEVFSALTDRTAGEYVKQGPGEITRAAALVGVLAHNAEMYGISTVYLRARNLVPPASERR